MYQNLQNAAYNSFDPNNYDPRVASTYDGEAGEQLSLQSAKPGQKLQINITLDNPSAATLTFELFSYLDSCVRRQKTDYSTGNYAYIPLLSHQGLAAVIATTDGTVGFDKDGNLAIHGDGAPADPIATISCKEVPYVSLFEASGIIPFNVAYVRYTADSDAQLDETLVYFSKSFSGGIEENTVSPRAYFRPNQFQSKTIDITVQFGISIDKGLRTTVLPTESVRLALFVTLWTV